MPDQDTPIDNPLEPSGNKQEEDSIEAHSAEEMRDAVRKWAKNKPEKFFEFMSMETIAGAGNPLHQKMTKEHIAQVIDLATRHDERQYNLLKNSQENEHSSGFSIRRYLFWGTSVVLVVIVCIILILKDNVDVLLPVLSGLGGLFAGLIGGIGIGKSLDK